MIFIFFQICVNQRYEVIELWKSSSKFDETFPKFQRKSAIY